MSTNTSSIAGTITPSGFVESGVTLIGEWNIKIIRADGRVERRTLHNVVTRAGMNRIANRAVQATGTTPAFVIVVGTQTATHSMESGQAEIGEVLRKTSAVLAANAQSREWFFLQCTIGGVSDSVTSVALESLAIADHPNSHASTGIFFNIVTGVAATLANSDLLDITGRIRVGSHNLSHST